MGEEDEWEDESLFNTASNQHSSAVAGPSRNRYPSTDDFAEEEAADSDEEDPDADQNREDVEGDEDERPNRFYGPSSTWRYYAEDERALAASLDQQRANDLGVHLYNARALKDRVRDPNAARKNKSAEGKKYWVKRNEDGSLPWHPSDRWTAWPMRPEDVPRKSEQHGQPLSELDGDEETYRKTEAWKPSTDLKEIIQGLMLKRVKEQFRAQRKDDPAPFSPSQIPQADSSPGTAIMVDGDYELGDEQPTPTLGGRSERQVPEMLLDDDVAARVLQPSVNHIMSRLDDLLLGLRDTQKRRVHRKSGTQTPTKRLMAASRDESVSPNETQELSGVASPNDAENQGQAEGQEEVQASGDAGLEDDEAESGQEAEPKRLGTLRDWSQVVAMASLMGWDPAVIDRAGRRCAALFSEDVGALEASRRNCPFTSCKQHNKPYEKAFRLHEHLKRKHKLTQDQVNAWKTGGQEDIVEETQDNTANGAWVCPLRSCNCKVKSFDVQWKLRRHMERRHKYTRKEINALQDRGWRLDHESEESEELDDEASDDGEWESENEMKTD